MLILWIIIFVVSLIAMSKAADYFTDASEKIGNILRFPHFVTGVLIVAVGTSLPELITSIFGVAKDEADILSGNVLGSTIANIFLGLGLVVVISRRTAKFNWDSVSNDMPFIIGALILLVLTILDGVFSFYEAIIFVLGYIIYVIYSLQIRKLNPKEIREDLDKEIKAHEKRGKKKNGAESQARDVLKTAFIFVISLAVVILAAKYVVDSVIFIATAIGLGTSALAASVIAIGTSLPEISVAISSAKKGHFDMVLGNIMGSNIFNILVVFGLVGLFTPISIGSQVLYFILPMTGAAILVQWLVTMDRKITVTEGLMMTLLYITFVAKLFRLF